MGKVLNLHVVVRGVRHRVASILSQSGSVPAGSSRDRLRAASDCQRRARARELAPVLCVTIRCDVPTLHPCTALQPTSLPAAPFRSCSLVSHLFPSVLLDSATFQGPPRRWWVRLLVFRYIDCSFNRSIVAEGRQDESTSSSQSGLVSHGTTPVSWQRENSRQPVQPLCQPLRVGQTSCLL